VFTYCGISKFFEENEMTLVTKICISIHKTTDKIDRYVANMAHYVRGPLMLQLLACKE
jgi:hypothetical protein